MQSPTLASARSERHVAGFGQALRAQAALQQCALRIGNVRRVAPRREIGAFQRGVHGGAEARAGERRATGVIVVFGAQAASSPLAGRRIGGVAGRAAPRTNRENDQVRQSRSMRARGIPRAQRLRPTCSGFGNASRSLAGNGSTASRAAPRAISSAKRLFASGLIERQRHFAAGQCNSQCAAVCSPG